MTGADGSAAGMSLESGTWKCSECKQPIGPDRPFIRTEVYKQERGYDKVRGHWVIERHEHELLHVDHLLNSNVRTGPDYVPMGALR